VKSTTAIDFFPDLAMSAAKMDDRLAISRSYENAECAGQTMAIVIMKRIMRWQVLTRLLIDFSP
jgi:hypothetical protein